MDKNFNKDTKNAKGQKDSVSKYGEEIPTNFAWMTLEEQKKRAAQLANISESGNKHNARKKNN